MTQTPEPPVARIALPGRHASSNASPKPPIRRILFDLDGTLWDTQKFHAQIESELMAELGVTIDPEVLTANYAGRPTDWVFKQVLRCSDNTAKYLMGQKWKRIFPQATSAEALGDLRDIFERLRWADIGFAIGTASPKEWAQLLLEANGLADMILVDDIVGGDMVQNGKPSPDIWQMAAGDTPPEHCLVVEDGIAGIEGAIAAGMPSVLLLPKRHASAGEITTLEDIFEYL